MKKTKFVELGDMYAEEGKFAEAYREYLEAAIGEKDLEAMVRLANMYLDEDYLSLDFEKAFHYMTMAYDIGMPAVELMERVVLDSEKIHEDEVGRREYKEFLEHIYDESVGYLNIWLADEHINGVFGTDIDKYIELCEKAARAGETYGYDCIGEMYFLGEHVERDYEKAYEYFTRSEENTGDIRYFYLGEMYKNGLYVEKDLKKAKEYYREEMKFLNRQMADPEDMNFYEPTVSALKELEEV
ncbi:MAG: hypothetical protein K6G75_05925 [Lachnospiraceae bacterium]|nr:hypothetical protein [Lachnospiraceae bacterium]